MNRPLSCLEDIADSMRFIRKFIGGMGQKEFLEDDKTQAAVVRHIEIIGEAAKQVPGEFRKKHPEIEWKMMAGMRDKLIHGYAGVDYYLVWGTASETIPKTLPSIEKLIGKE